MTFWRAGFAALSLGVGQGSGNLTDCLGGLELDGGVLQHGLDELESFLVRNLGQAGQDQALLIGVKLGSQELLQCLNLLLDGELDRFFAASSAARKRGCPACGGSPPEPRQGDLKHIRQEFRVAGVNTGARTAATWMGGSRRRSQHAELLRTLGSMSPLQIGSSADTGVARRPCQWLQQRLDVYRAVAGQDLLAGGVKGLGGICTLGPRFWRR